MKNIFRILILNFFLLNLNYTNSQIIIYDNEKNSHLLELKEKHNIPDSTFKKLDLWRNDKCGCNDIRFYSKFFFYKELIFLNHDIATALSIDDIILLFGFPNQTFILLNETYKKDNTLKYMILFKYNTESFCTDDETFSIKDVAWVEFYFDINTKKFLKYSFNIS